MDSFGFFCGLLAAVFSPETRVLELSLEIATPFAHRADGFAICVEPGDLAAMVTPPGGSTTYSRRDPSSWAAGILSADPSGVLSLRNLSASVYSVGYGGEAGVRDTAGSATTVPGTAVPSLQTLGANTWRQSVLEVGTLADILHADPKYAHSYRFRRLDDFSELGTPRAGRVALPLNDYFTPSPGLAAVEPCALVTASAPANTRLELKIHFVLPEGVNGESFASGGGSVGLWAAPMQYRDPSGDESASSSGISTATPTPTPGSAATTTSTTTTTASVNVTTGAYVAPTVFIMRGSMYGRDCESPGYSPSGAVSLPSLTPSGSLYDPTVRCGTERPGCPAGPVECLTLQTSTTTREKTTNNNNNDDNDNDNTGSRADESDDARASAAGLKGRLSAKQTTSSSQVALGSLMESLCASFGALADEASFPYSRIGSGKFLLHAFSDLSAAAIDDESLFSAYALFRSSYGITDGRRPFSPTHATGIGPNCMRCKDGMFTDVTTGDTVPVPDREHSSRAALRVAGYVMHQAGWPCDSLYTENGDTDLMGSLPGGAFF